LDLDITSDNIDTLPENKKKEIRFQIKNIYFRNLNDFNLK